MYSPVSDNAASYFDTSSSYINALSVESLAMYVFVSPIAAYYLKTRGIRINIVVSAGITAVGAVIKVLACFSGIFVVDMSIMTENLFTPKRHYDAINIDKYNITLTCCLHSYLGMTKSVILRKKIVAA